MASLLIQRESITKILIKAVFLFLGIKLKALFLGCITLNSSWMLPVSALLVFFNPACYLLLKPQRDFQKDEASGRKRGDRRQCRGKGRKDLIPSPFLIR